MPTTDSKFRFTKNRDAGVPASPIWLTLRKLFFPLLDDNCFVEAWPDTHPLLPQGFITAIRTASIVPGDELKGIAPGSSYEKWYVYSRYQEYAADEYREVMRILKASDEIATDGLAETLLAQFLVAKPRPRGRAIAVVGGTGTGKTTFVRHVVSHIQAQAPDVPTHFLYIDFNKKASTASAMKSRARAEVVDLLSDVIHQAISHIFDDDYSDELWQYIIDCESIATRYRGKLRRLQEQGDFEAYGSKLEEIQEYIIEKRHHGFCECLLRFLVRRKTWRIVLCFDNSDPLSSTQQKAIYGHAIELAHATDVDCIVTLRSTSVFARSLPDPDHMVEWVLFLSPPLISEVIEKRVELLMDPRADAKRAEVPFHVTEGVSFTFRDVRDFFKWLTKMQFDEDVHRAMQRLCNYDIRRALELFDVSTRSRKLYDVLVDALGSQRDWRENLEDWRKTHALPHFLTTSILLTRALYQFEDAIVPNVFSCDRPDERGNDFVKLRVLHLLKASSSGATGIELAQKLECLDYGRALQNSALKDLVLKKCVTVDAEDPKLSELFKAPFSFRITHRGRYIVELADNFLYLSLIKDDCWIRSSFYEEPPDNEYLMTRRERANRVFLFLEHLRQEELCELRHAFEQGMHRHFDAVFGHVSITARQAQSIANYFRRSEDQDWGPKFAGLARRWEREDANLHSRYS